MISPDAPSVISTVLLAFEPGCSNLQRRPWIKIIGQGKRPKPQDFIKILTYALPLRVTKAKGLRTSTQGNFLQQGFPDMGVNISHIPAVSDKEPSIAPLDLKKLKDTGKGISEAEVGKIMEAASKLISQLNILPVGDDDGKKNWLHIIKSLSCEAATILKPDKSNEGGMDPRGYVKVKCIAAGHPSESAVVKGVVCKKNVAHRRMTSKIDKPRFLILGGALEYQSISNHLSSFDTLLQQEMDTAAAKISAHRPSVILVEKYVSRDAQEFLLSKSITLVLNVKRKLLERVARCTGAQIIPSVDHLTSTKMGHCDVFHVEKIFEEHGQAKIFDAKTSQWLTLFQILLKGANGDELKKVKHVVQRVVFSAYNLALETSFLADEGATLPELPLKSPITFVAPDKLSGIDRSIPLVPGFTIPSSRKPMASQSINELQKSNRDVPSLNHAFQKIDDIDPKESVQIKTASSRVALTGKQLISLSQRLSEAPQQGRGSNHAAHSMLAANHLDGLELASSKQEPVNNNEEAGSSKEEFTQFSDHQSILVSLSTRCFWKGTVVNGLVSSESNTMGALISRWGDFYKIICLIRASIVIHVRCLLKHMFIVILIGKVA
ncbi:hypothetical protein V6N11_061344 [Hibiscus sabdariffa]|uniref:1-phosphatidylinositol-3-phosphate 5-kinase n=1 Tax=Hibiscus sabdariffa TaxID=183260 RepID=A0ABR2NVB0_9ROSI